MTDPVTAEVWAEHSVWPQDPQFPLALAGGVTTMQILPGSANLIGGRGVTVKNVPARHVDADEVPGRPLRPQDGLRREPQAGLRRARGAPPPPAWATSPATARAWIEAAELPPRAGTSTSAKMKDGGQGRRGRPARDLELETLAGVLAARSWCRTIATAPTRC